MKKLVLTLIVMLAFVANADAQDNPSAATSTDFKRGSVIMFQDDVTAEKVGEFPSKWDLLKGG